MLCLERYCFRYPTPRTLRLNSHAWQWIPPWTWPNKRGRTPKKRSALGGMISDTHPPNQVSRLKSRAQIRQWIPPWTWPNRNGRTTKECSALRGTVSDTQLLELSGLCLTPKLGSGFHPGGGRTPKREVRSALNRSQYGNCSTKYNTTAGS